MYATRVKYLKRNLGRNVTALYLAVITSFDACLQDKEKVRAGRVRRLAGWKAERAPNTHRAPPGEPLRVRGVSRGLHPPPSSRTGTRRSPGSSSGAAKLACRAESSASGEVSERTAKSPSSLDWQLRPGEGARA